MGTIITNKTLLGKNQSGISKPIIYCSPSSDLLSQAVPLNHTLAELLIGYKINRRSFQIENCLKKSLSQLPDDVIIKDFDVLFHPDYKIDVLKILINTCKTKPFRIIWPGRLQDGKLYYAEEGFADYKEYNVEDYDVTCVQGG